MQIIALSILLVNLSALGGNSSNKPAREADVKSAAPHSDLDSNGCTGKPACVFEADEKRDSAHEAMIVDIAKKMALECSHASPWGKELMVDGQGKPTTEFEMVSQIPPEAYLSLLTIAQKKPYFPTSGYMLMREFYEAVLGAALPGARNQEIARCLAPVLMQQGPKITGVIEAYGDRVAPIHDVLVAVNDMWQLPETADEWLNEAAPMPAYKAFCEKYSKVRFPFAHTSDRQSQMDVAVFIPAGNGAHPDRIECESCKQITDESGKHLGIVTGLFWTWKTIHLYHKDGCPNKEQAFQQLTRDHRKEAYKYDTCAPDITNNPATYLGHVLGHVDRYARRNAGSSDEVGKLSQAWLHALLTIEKRLVVAAALVHDLNVTQQEQAKHRAIALASYNKNALKDGENVGESKKRKDSDDMATPE